MEGRRHSSSDAVNLKVTNITSTHTLFCEIKGHSQNLPIRRAGKHRFPTGGNPGRQTGDTLGK